MPVIASIALLIYGMIIISMLLNVRIMDMPPRTRCIAITTAAAIIASNALAMYLLGQARYGLFYPLLVQLPLYIGFSFFTPYKGVKLLFVLLSTIIFVAPPLICVTALRTFYQIEMPTALFVFFSSYVLMILFVYRFLKTDFNYILENCESRLFWLFCLIPALHYIYSYTRTGYNFIQPFAQESYFIRLIPSIIVFASYILLVRVFRNTRETQRLQGENNMMNLHLETANLRLYEMKSAQEQTVAYRHDMRHHLSLLRSFAIDGDIEKIRLYLADALTTIDEITPSRYCENDTVNLILSSFTTRAKNADVTLHIDAKLPASLAISAPELCSLLSNALENAIIAAASLKNKHDRNVSIRCLLKDDKLLVSTENMYADEIEMVGGLPKSKTIGKGHGYGMKNIVNIVNCHNGLYSIETTAKVFNLQLVLPLGKENQRQ